MRHVTASWGATARFLLAALLLVGAFPARAVGVDAPEGTCHTLLDGLVRAEATMRASTAYRLWRNSAACQAAAAQAAAYRAAGCEQQEPADPAACRAQAGAWQQARHLCAQVPSRCRMYASRSGQLYEALLHALWRQGCRATLQLPLQPAVTCADLEMALQAAGDALRDSVPYLEWVGTPECQAMQATALLHLQARCADADPQAVGVCQAIATLHAHDRAFCMLVPQRCAVEVSPEWVQYQQQRDSHSGAGCAAPPSTDVVEVE